MDILANINELGNKLNNTFNLEKIQDEFLNSKFGQIANAAVDIGLKSLLPDVIEDEVIEVKDSLITGGLKEGIDTAIKNTIEVGKKALGITASFEDIKQVQDAFQNGSFINGVSKAVDVTLEGLQENSIISKEISTIIKSGKDILVDSLKQGVSNEFSTEIKAFDKIQKYTDNWMKFYKNKNLEGITNEFNKIQKQLKKIVPLESVINNISKMASINELIKNSDNFDFSEIYLDLAESLN